MLRDRSLAHLRLVVVGGHVTDTMQQFLRALPGQPGFAVIVAGDGLGAHTLEGDTRLPVVEVSRTARIETNTIFVIPKDRVATLRSGELVTVAADGNGTGSAVDRLLRSVADEVGQSATGVILSGRGIDGALGIRRLKEVGGLTVAQLANGDDDDEMPRAALATGAVDLVLPLERIAPRLVEISRTTDDHPDLEVDEPRPTEAVADTLRDILTLIRSRTTNDFSAYKRATLHRRIARRMLVCECTTVAHYHQYLRDHPAELPSLLRDFLISVTNFFRDPETFEALARDVIPKLFANKGPSDAVRVWVAGCATGEEAYSLGILLFEHAAKLDAPPQIQIFATDIDEAALGEARLGVYPASISVDVSQARLQRFFTHENAKYRVAKELRETMLFSPHNLLRDPPFSRLDLISCRNLLIYLNREAQNRVLSVFHFGLRADGYLLLGSSESADNSPLFAAVDPKLRLFTRKAVPAAFIEPLAPMPRWHPAEVGPSAPHDRMPSMGELHYQAVEQYAPPSVLVDSELEIVHVSEHAGEFLQVAGGEPTRQLLRLAHPALRLDLRTAIYAARQQRGLATRTVRFEDKGVVRAVEIRVRQVDRSELGSGAALVMFDELPPSEPIRDPSPGAAIEPVVRELEDELLRTRDQLRTTVEQYETSLEELKASNEELQAINEELRSATEELETSKEEMQSVNEELSTVNHELKSKVDEISHANSDLQNLMSATDIGVIFLDRELRIKRYTPRVQDLFNIIPSDLGRPFAHLTHRLEIGDLCETAQSVLQTLHSAERDVASRDGRRYLVRWLPYRSRDDRIEGIVLTFVDVHKERTAVDAQRRSAAALGVAEGRLRVMLQGASIALFQFDNQLNLEWAHVRGREMTADERNGGVVIEPNHEKQLRTLAQLALTKSVAQRTDLEIRIDGVARTYELRIEPSPAGVLAVGIER